MTTLTNKEPLSSYVTQNQPLTTTNCCQPFCSAMKHYQPQLFFKSVTDHELINNHHPEPLFSAIITHHQPLSTFINHYEPS